jgi:hypothetical protein
MRQLVRMPNGKKAAMKGQRLDSFHRCRFGFGQQARLFSRQARFPISLVFSSIGVLSPERAAPIRTAHARHPPRTPVQTLAESIGIAVSRRPAMVCEDADAFSLHNARDQ